MFCQVLFLQLMEHLMVRTIQSSGFAIGMFIALVFVNSGCWNNSKKVVIGKVTGKVTLDGTALPSGCGIHFVPNFDNGQADVSVVKDDGSYTVSNPKYQGLPVGEYRIRVVPPPQDPKEAEDEGRKALATVITAMQAGKRNIPAPKSSRDQIVPQKYWSELTSELKFVVKEGENTADFELKTAGKNSK